MSNALLPRGQSCEASTLSGDKRTAKCNDYDEKHHVQERDEPRWRHDVARRPILLLTLWHLRTDRRSRTVLAGKLNVFRCLLQQPVTLATIKILVSNTVAWRRSFCNPPSSDHCDAKHSILRGSASDKR